jgi:hypothetical protein
VSWGPLLYLLHTADLPTSTKSTAATFADDPAILAIASDTANQPRHNTKIVKEMEDKS